MSLSINSSAAVANVPLASNPGAAISSATGGGLPFGLGTAATGAGVAQPPSGAASIIKKVLIGGVLGAGLGFGASFLTLPIIGQVAAPIAAAVGGAIGALGGLAVGLLQRRKQNLAMQAQAQGQVPQGMPVNAPPATGVTLKYKSKGAAVTTLQRQLSTLGLYKGKASGSFDKNTADAIRKYEVMKGVMPKGAGTPEVRAAVSQDVRLLNQYT